MVVAELNEALYACPVHVHGCGGEHVLEEKSELGGQRMVRTPGVGVASRLAWGARGMTKHLLCCWCGQAGVEMMQCNCAVQHAGRGGVVD